ncbi:MAG: sulfatase-like hydrolase/transferase [Planctomycetota bacterium]|jgi:arylsulfatase A-like enzyme/Tfp pilus assembly protein PilF
MNRILDKKQFFGWQLCVLVLVILVGTLWLFRGGLVSSKDIRHVILISIDTCRADYLGCYGYHRPTTPNIDRLAAQSILFENVISQVPITLPSHCSMLTGTIPPYHGVHNNSDYKLGESNVTLAEILTGRGFATGAIVSAFVLDSQFGLDQGFDSYNDSFEEPVRNLLYFSQRRGAEASRFAGAWLEKHKNKKFFLFLHYFDPHIKYTPPEPFASEFADNLYAGEIAYTDYCIGQVIERLKDLDIYDSTLLIVTADHGEMLGEHGEDDHTYFIYQPAIKVPLIFKLPGRHKPQKVKNLVGLIDIMPTVCSLLGIEAPAHVQGKDLSKYFDQSRTSGQNRHIYCESLTPTRYGAAALLGLVTDRFKYIQTARPELYDIVEDAGETKNLLDQQPHRARILQDRLKQLLQQTLRNDTSTKVDLDEQAIKRLQSLGYVAGDISEDFDFDQSGDDPKDLVDFHNIYTSVSDLVLNKEYEQAEKICQQLILRRPHVYQIYVLMTSIAREQGDLDRAVSHLNRAIEVRPDVAKLQHYLGTVLTEQGKFDQGAEHFEKSLQLNPNEFLVHQDLAAVFYKQKKFDQAITHLTEALRLRPDSDKTVRRIGDALAEKGNFRQATKYFQQAVDMNPQDMENHSKLASALEFQGRYDEAAKQLRTGIRIMSENGRNDEAVELQKHLELIEDMSSDNK